MDYGSSPKGEQADDKAHSPTTAYAGGYARHALMFWNVDGVSLRESSEWPWRKT
jgi:hypothetical protein